MRALAIVLLLAGCECDGVLVLDAGPRAPDAGHDDAALDLGCRTYYQPQDPTRPTDLPVGFCPWTMPQ
jgi:hypothetical protein